MKKSIGFTNNVYTFILFFGTLFLFYPKAPSSNSIDQEFYQVDTLKRTFFSNLDIFSEARGKTAEKSITNSKTYRKQLFHLINFIFP